MLVGISRLGGMARFYGNRTASHSGVARAFHLFTTHTRFGTNETHETHEPGLAIESRMIMIMESSRTLINT